MKSRHRRNETFGEEFPQQVDCETSMAFDQSEGQSLCPKMKNLRIEIDDPESMKSSMVFNHFDMLKRNQIETPRD